MSNLSPDFVLPENFCANPQEAWTIPARFYTDQNAFEHEKEGNDSNLLIVFYVQIMPDDFVMQLHRF